MRRPLIILSAAALSLGLFAPVAGAAVPKREARITAHCPDSGRSAQVWYRTSKGKLTQLAAKNPCSGWLRIDYGGSYYNSSPENALLVAPGAHFTWGKAQLAGVAQYTYASVPQWAGIVTPNLGDDGQPCDGGPTSFSLVYRYNDVRVMPSC